MKPFLQYLNLKHFGTFLYSVNFNLCSHLSHKTEVKKKTVSDETTKNETAKAI